MDDLSKEKFFYIELSTNINFDDFRLLRRLYLPIVGLNSIITYEFLYDQCLDNPKKLFNFDLISRFLTISFEEIELALNNLEATGLTKRYIKNDNNISIIQLEKPLSIERFNKNSLLKNHLIRTISLNEYEKIIFNEKNNHFNKADFIDATKKYQDVFALDFIQELEKSNSDYSTMDLVVEASDDHEENIKKLPSTHFIKYFLKRNASFSETQLINELLKMGFSDASINVLLDFSIKFNDRIVQQYVLKIAQDFFYRSIIAYEDVKHEISIIEKAKTKKYNVEYVSKSNVKTEANSLNTSTTKEISIKDIFSDDDMKEMF